MFLLIFYVARPKDVVCQVLLQAQYLWPCAKHNNISVKALCQYYVCISLYGCFTWPAVTSAVKLLTYFTLVWLFFKEKIEKRSPLTTRLLSSLSSYPILDLVAGRSEPSYPLSLSLYPHCPSLLTRWSFFLSPQPTATFVSCVLLRRERVTQYAAIVFLMHNCSIKVIPLTEMLLCFQGIYETKVPLEFNAILQVGCVCKVDKAAKKRNSHDGWNLSELHMKTTTECPYLDQSIAFFYLYHR